MINNTLSSYGTSTNSIDTELHSITQGRNSIGELETTLAQSPNLPITPTSTKLWLVLAAAVFLVSVPVFIEAPLVRSLPSLSLAMTGLWVWLSFTLMSRSATYLWGDLLLGFSWSWLAGAIYWGWFRWEPLWHLPVESIGLPFACWCLARNWHKVGSWFYLGSLFGTVLTDVYFYVVDLMPYWRQIMRVEPEAVPAILQTALIQVQTPWGQTWAGILALLLLTLGILPLFNQKRHWYAFGGAVLSTILVDSLFLLAAIFA
ncbi:DUF3120 domain-containing protein [Calothrix sp. FACHB-1219]|uniref:DUF3120 domain-containing protein n=1 Tax=unclassified Calothrix TaxID=2619626 RepID=UPI0016888B51|nr:MULTISPECIES: DUF3120 domain-containing protein [unclassified Calothrix]MBD2204683.1 DUF3120 domain-containing protein [Calothrix sp. FACHB-168]MBD2216805.1 DUF3120 domain-containing protein [Calothrix sp. FACHB-1219]